MVNAVKVPLAPTLLSNTQLPMVAMAPAPLICRSFTVVAVACGVKSQANKFNVPPVCEIELALDLNTVDCI